MIECTSKTKDKSEFDNDYNNKHGESANDAESEAMNNNRIFFEQKGLFWS